jgi:hypothetical protein
MHVGEIFFVVLWKSLITIKDAQTRQHAKKREDITKEKRQSGSLYADGIH